MPVQVTALRASEGVTFVHELVYNAGLLAVARASNLTAFPNTFKGLTCVNLQLIRSAVPASGVAVLINSHTYTINTKT